MFGRTILSILLCSALLAIAFWVDTGVSKGQVTCDQQCHLRNVQYNCLAPPKCVYFAWSTCQMCSGPGNGTWCVNTNPNSKPCNPPGESIVVTPYDRCGFACTCPDQANSVQGSIGGNPGIDFNVDRKFCQDPPPPG
jgi:hypothetical protein